MLRISASEGTVDGAALTNSAPAVAPGKLITNIDDPAFQQWMKTVATLSAYKQVEAVTKKLQELNPGFDGKVTADFEGRSVTELRFVTDNVTDISPLPALPGLQSLTIHGSDLGGGKVNGRLSSLSQLEGMQLTVLNCEGNSVLADLSPLTGMKLTNLNCGTTEVSDLSPLQGMPLTTLRLVGSRVSDLSPLKGMHLKSLEIRYTQVSDLSPLQGMALTSLICFATPVADLSPLRGMPLTFLWCLNAPVSDLSPLEDCKNLRELKVIKTKVTAAAVAALQKALPNCKIEWDDPAKPKTPEPAASGTK